MHTRQTGAADYRAPRARTLRGTASQKTAAEDRGIPKAVRRASRRGRHTRPSHPTLRFAAVPLYRHGKGAFAACAHSCSPQLGADCRVVEWHVTSRDAALPLGRTPARTGLRNKGIEFATSVKSA